MTRAREISNVLGRNIESTTFTATANQTAFSITHAAGRIQVYMNGLLLDPTVDWTSDGSTVTLTEGAVAGDELEVVKFDNLAVADAIPRTGHTGTIDFSSATFSVPTDFVIDNAPAGFVINKEIYGSGYGSSAGVLLNTQNWVTMPNTGTNYSGPRYSTNLTVCVFNKKKANSKIVVTPHLHGYQANTNSGWGMRIKHARTYAGAASGYDNDILTDGPFHGWGAGGYGSSSVAAADAATMSTCLNDAHTVYNSHTGDIYVYMEVKKWSSGDTVYLGNYNASSSYPKYWTMVIEEIAQ